jgi:hypothetical protein
MLRVPVSPVLRASAVLSVVLLAGCGGGGKDNPDSVPAVPADALHVSCLEQPDPGPCRAAKPAYYFDYQSDSCRQFLWGGCQGNVPFESLDECLRMCKGGR